MSGNDDENDEFAPEIFASHIIYEWSNIHPGPNSQKQLQHETFFIHFLYLTLGLSEKYRVAVFGHISNFSSTPALIDVDEVKLSKTILEGAKQTMLEQESKQNTGSFRKKLRFEEEDDDASKPTTLTLKELSDMLNAIKDLEEYIPSDKKNKPTKY